MFARVNVGGVCQYFHLLLEFILEEAVVDADDSLYVDARYHVLHQVFWVEARLDQVYTTHEPLFTRLPLL